MRRCTGSGEEGAGQAGAAAGTHRAGAALKRAASDTLSVIFSSRLAPSVVGFDFAGLAGRRASTVLLLRDDGASSHLHRGVAGLGDSPPAASGAIEEIRRHLAARRIVTCGSSAGGHGAALHGQLLDADPSVAMNGLNFLDPRLSAAKGGGQGRRPAHPRQPRGDRRAPCGQQGRRPAG